VCMDEREGARGGVRRWARVRSLGEVGLVNILTTTSNSFSTLTCLLNRHPMNRQA
jgi:hypothetical protein